MRICPGLMGGMTQPSCISRSLHSVERHQHDIEAGNPPPSCTTPDDFDNEVPHNDYWSVYAPFDDWKYEVANDTTRLGYWQWVRQKIRQEAEGKNR